ncbi:YrrS family protein [Bacillus weihaiensis]|uniref:DUF1510 domain-containing protein n=1 Tax=Bacillus weihaiensis TaxID=1547283 RepID=A0A1L3MPP8_9BACI|nr:YrrS family protein [Bacillus weihaiensis]APH04299.1 hypothetical protein A9C19_05825 [Bacillus weihaiensis]
MSYNELNHSRFEKRDKKRKSNIVLNTLIGLVLVLILFVGSQLILGGNSEKTAKYNEQPDVKLLNEEEKNDAEAKEEKQEIDENKADGESTLDEDGDGEPDQQEGSEEELNDPSDQAIITEGDPESEIAETIENPGWSPVGTSQTEPHTADYTKGSQDWTEMTKALSYATGIPESDMIIWFLGNNGSPNDAVGTISPKDQSIKYKVYITWVENKGWKPIKIEKLN